MSDFTFRIIKEIGVIAEYKTGWHKELNLISWNEGPAKYDIRDFDTEHEHMSKGITLFGNEARTLAELLNKEFASDEDKSDRKLILEIKEKLEMLLGRDPGEAETDDDEVNEFYEEAKNLHEAIERLGY